MNLAPPRLLLACAFGAISLIHPAGAAEAPTAEKIGSHLTVIHGPVNGALVEANGKHLAVYGDPRGNPPPADRVLLTDARRDVAWAARELAGQGAVVLVPEKEAALLERPEEFWQRFDQARFHNYSQVSTKVPATGLSPARAITPGEAVQWQGLPITVLSTPGYTPGSVTYVLTLEGKRIAFTGNLIYGDGRLLDLYSFQDAIPAAKIGGYHGYAARLGDLITSLRQVADAKPDLIIPARGPVIEHPAEAINTLIGRAQALYSNYLSIDALRWYFGDQHILTKARRVLGPEASVPWMTMAETNALPPWVTAIDNSRFIRAADGAGFVVDCGSKQIVDRLQDLHAEGRLTWLDDIFISHYHDDHTDQVPTLAAAFGSTVLACRELCEVLEHPDAYALPCLTRNPILVSGKLTSGASWRWREFQMAAWSFPGQTLYHEALLVQKDGGESIFFVGDSFTPSGIDDYCPQNRNFLHPDSGYFRCLEMLKRLPAGCWLVNQHVEPMFRFSPAQLEQMRATLEARVALLRSLFPWDDPNYGLDESWARLQPYGFQVRGKQPFTCRAVLFNHSPTAGFFEVRPHLPAGWALKSLAPSRVLVPPRQEGIVEFTAVPDAGAPPGLYVITADVSTPQGEFREWTEAMARVLP